MAKKRANENLSKDERKEIFLALVQIQDGHVNVTKSRQVIADRFGISDREVRGIEREGIDGEWPPLD